MTTSTDAIQSAFLNGFAQFDGISSQSLQNQFQTQLDNLAKQAQIRNDAVMIRQIRQVSQAFQDLHGSVQKSVSFL